MKLIDIIGTDLFVTNEKFLQEGVSISSVRKLDNPYKFTYPISWRPDYEDTENIHTTPMIYFGPQAPYMVKGVFHYLGHVNHWPSGQATWYPMSEEMLLDKGWKEFKYGNFDLNPKIKRVDYHKMIACLKFYANKDNWKYSDSAGQFDIYGTIKDDCFSEDVTEGGGIDYGGKRARELLKEMGIEI